MKNISILTVLIILACSSCREEPIGQTPTDGVAPGSIISYQVERAPGGAIISYELPDDDDLLYVKAVYHINGVEKKTTSSIYNKKLEVMGFGSVEEQFVSLYCVDRSGNHSPPVEVRFNPDTPPVQTIFQSLNMTTGFGGIQIFWNNPNKADVVIYLIAADSTGELAIADVVYSNAIEGKFSLRGFDTIRRTFGAFIRDKWDNYSDTILAEFAPLYEKRLDRTLFVRNLLPGDNTTQYDGGSWAWDRLYDDVIGDQGWHTGSGSVPMYFTIDLGVTAQLSRYTLWHRQGAGWVYAHHNPKRWKIYGTTSIANDKPEDYWKGAGFKDDWTLLADCYSIKPSGDDNPFVTQEDIDYAANGFEFEFDSNLPPVRYIRFHIESNWSGGDMLHISELRFWGEILN